MIRASPATGHAPVPADSVVLQHGLVFRCIHFILENSVQTDLRPALTPLKSPVMFSFHFHRTLMAGVLAASTMIISGCRRPAVVPAEEHFLSRRVDALEDKVADLEVRLAQVSRGREGAETGSTADPGMGGFESEEAQARLRVLKIRQLETAPRADLPGMIENLGFSAPELARFRRDLKLLEEKHAALIKGEGAEGAAYTEILGEIDKAKYRLELAAEGVRTRLLEESRETVQKVEAMRRQLDEGAPRDEASGPR